MKTLFRLTYGTNEIMLLLLMRLISSIPIDDEGVKSIFFNEHAFPLIEGEQNQFAEVRVCRLLLYLQDRADIGVPILNRVFASFLIRVADIYKSLTQGHSEVEEVTQEINLDRNSMRLPLDLKKKSPSTYRIGTTDSIVENEKE
ncbi:unnamed protein product [Cylicocyclus nassatus]|uniref:Uncharacterized protein n=1 Tax=Cylicocyclus nassatus TaxID=53992 RepID=A0AA36GN65_CYLNA|nr:unnamed protein product [Cylicocyclus nassatus]